MTEKCDVGKLLEEQCNKLDFVRTIGITNMSDLNVDNCEELLWRAGLLSKQNDIKTICKHHEQVYGYAYLKKQRKCRDVWSKHKRKVNGDRIITLEMARQLEGKGVTVVPGQKFCWTCVAHYETVISAPAFGFCISTKCIPKLTFRMGLFWK